MKKSLAIFSIAVFMGIAFDLPAQTDPFFKGKTIRIMAVPGDSTKAGLV